MAVHVEQPGCIGKDRRIGRLAGKFQFHQQMILPCGSGLSRC